MARKARRSEAAELTRGNCLLQAAVEVIVIYLFCRSFCIFRVIFYHRCTRLLLTRLYDGVMRAAAGGGGGRQANSTAIIEFLGAKKGENNAMQTGQGHE